MANLNKNSIHRIRAEVIRSGNIQPTETIAYTSFRGAKAPKQSSMAEAIAARRKDCKVVSAKDAK